MPDELKPKDIRGSICKIISEMLDNPTDGIYPTTKCYNQLEALFNSRPHQTVAHTGQIHEHGKACLCDACTDKFINEVKTVAGDEVEGLAKKLYEMHNYSRTFESNEPKWEELSENNKDISGFRWQAKEIIKLGYRQQGKLADNQPKNESHTLSIQCNFCPNRLSMLGGLLFSPPNGDGTCQKQHLCIDCYVKFIHPSVPSVEIILQAIIEFNKTFTSSPCGCLGPKDGELYCPCLMVKFRKEAQAIHALIKGGKWTS